MIAATACLAWVGMTASVAAWATLRSRRVPAPATTDVSVLLLRPCAGSEENLARALESSAVIPRLPAVRFLIESESDGARPVAEEVCAALVARGHAVQVVVTGARAANRKTDQLARAVVAERSDWDVLVVADGDVELTAGVMADLVGPLVRGDAAASWAPPVEIAPRTWADRASQAILDGSLHAFALLSALDARGMVGKLFAIRRDALASIGGFDALVSYLGEDMEIARRLREAGLRVHVTATAARSLAQWRSWSDVVRRYGRWMTVLRAQRPWLLVSYPLLLASAPLQVALAIVAMVGHPVAGAVALGLALMARYGLAGAARVRSLRSLEGILLAPWLADATLLVALAVAVSSRRVRWRGVALRIDRRNVVAEAKR